MGGSGHRAARRAAARWATLGFLGIRYPVEYGGSGPDALAIGDARRGARPLDLRRLHRHRAGAHRHGVAAPRRRRHAGAKASATCPDHRRRDDHRRRGHRARRRLRRRRHPHHARGATATTGCSTAPRCSSPTACIADVVFRRRQDRPEAQGLARHLDVHRREGHAGLLGRRASWTRQGWRCSDTAELVFEDCRMPAAQPARRGEPRLLRDHEELPERAHGARRDGGRRGDRGAST